MIPHPSPEDVKAELGDKVLDAVSLGVAHAKEQFGIYQQQHPDWLASNTKRTVASLIHDWMWAAVAKALDEAPHVVIIDRDPVRELAIRVESEHRLSYLLRLKRHHLDGSTSSYQTQTVIDFELQGPNQTFPGYGEVRLEAGYEWDADTRAMGGPLITLRDGRDNVLWTLPLTPHTGIGGGTVTQPTTPGPVLPSISLQSEDEARDENGTGSDQS
ncbi:hypothetical protein [Pseudonocardia acaciae]|uniref:hypothetical protein n=1 Tax=Pseudonocardia acaciae TaxID=551276 RepID=UPI0007E8CA00|nr:hypothetical protein [Pseudonocardia acaciae]